MKTKAVLVPAIAVLACAVIVAWRRRAPTASAPTVASPMDGSPASDSADSSRVGVVRVLVEPTDPPRPVEGASAATDTPASQERYPDAPGIPGQLPFASGSIEERAWILRRALRDLKDIEDQRTALHKLGGEMLPTAIGGILDLQGRGLDRPEGKFVVPRAGSDEYVFMSQNKCFLFKRFEFPEYDLYRYALEAREDWSRLGNIELWRERSTAWIESSVRLLEASIPR